MKKILGIVLVLSIYLCGCGKVAKAVSDGGGSNSSNNPGTAMCSLTIQVSPNATLGSVICSPNGTSFASGTTINLTASANAGYMFSVWTGAVSSNTNVISVCITNNMLVTATFTTIPPVQYALNTTVVGSGSVAKAPNQAQYTAGDNVQLTATPISGWAFTGWSEDLSGVASSVTLNMNAQKNVTATFKQIFTLSTVASPSIGGSVSVSATTAVDGSSITVQAIPQAGYVFTGWAGDATGNTNPLNVLMSSNKNITAVFNAIAMVSLNVSLSAGSQGVVSTEKNGSYLSGTAVTLSGTPSAGNLFNYWFVSPDNTTISTGKQITVTLNKNTDISFATQPFPAGARTYYVSNPTGTPIVYGTYESYGYAFKARITYDSKFWYNQTFGYYVSDSIFRIVASSDGSKLLLENGHGQIFLMNHDGSDGHYLCDGSDASFNSTGTQILFKDGVTGYLCRMNLDGTGKTVVTTDGGILNPVYSKDDSKIVYAVVPTKSAPLDGTEPSGIVVMNSNGTNKQIIDSGFWSTTQFKHPSFSPDGLSVVYYKSGSNLVVSNISGTTKTTIPGVSDEFFVWSKDNRIFFMHAGSIKYVNPASLGTQVQYFSTGETGIMPFAASF